MSLFAVGSWAGLSAAPTPAAAPRSPAAEIAPASDETTIELSPFIVSTESDRSYGALNSNSVTSFKTELGKLAISADIFTSAFMEDTNSSTLENMLRAYSAGTGTGSAAGDVGGMPVNQPMDRGGGDSVSAGVQLRGLGAAVVKQDGFMLPAPAGTGLNSNFGTERVEVINGPQALLYGNGGGGGVVNIVSKQARLNRKGGGALRLQYDQYGHRLGQFDYQVGGPRLGLTLSLLHQELGDNRLWMGGPLDGAYLQVVTRVTGNTVVRVTGKQTHFDRFIPQTMTLNATSTTADARHGQQLRYLLATGQMAASATGPSSAGLIGNGLVTWDNVDSLGGSLREEITTARLAAISADTVWNRWLSTQVAVGYQDKASKVSFGSGLSFFAPTANGNPLPGEWTVGTGGSSGSAWSHQPSRSRSFRTSALFTHALFGGRAHSQTIAGYEYTQGAYANENFAYYEADANWNVLVNPAVATNGGRTRLLIPHPWFSVQHGLVRRPFDQVGTERIVYQGKNYVAQVMNLTDPALVSPQNPQGVTAGDLFIHSRAISSGAFLVNHTQWQGGRLVTLAGLRWVAADQRQFPSAAIPAVTAAARNLSFSLGANYGLTSWLRPYAAVSDTYNLPGVLLTVPADPYGKAAPISHSLGGELGVKIGAADGRLSGSLALFGVQAKDDPYAIPTQLRDSINPAGLNGRYLGATGSVIAVQRESRGVQAALTAAPTSAWRLRLSAAWVRGSIGNDTRYPTLYNDQFYTNAQGQVTYADGTVVYVRPTYLNTPGTAANAGYIPLTVASLSTPGNAYYANPDPETGLLRTSNGRTILNYVHATHGSIRTGVAGLPISRLQVTGVNPVPEIVTSAAGDRTTGYPEWSANFTGLYTVPNGIAKGVKLGGTVSAAWRTADYYYYPNGYSVGAPRVLFYRPTRVLCDAILGYEWRWKRVTWSTQVNINNLFNHYTVLILPNNITGYSGLNRALFSNQPREYTWTCTVKF